MESAFFLLYHLYRRQTEPLCHNPTVSLCEGMLMDYFIDGIICEKWPERSTEETLRGIMEFNEQDFIIRGTGRYEPNLVDLRKEMGKNLQILRNNINHTQDQLGMVLGVNQSDISNIENGNRMLTVPKIRMLSCYVPDIDLNVLFGKKSKFKRPTDQKYYFVCSILNPIGFDYLNDQLSILMNIPRFHI